MQKTSEGRTWETAGEQEDWLRMKGKILGYITQVLANRLRDEFASLPAQVVHLVYGYVTPVAAEYVRRAIWRETALSVYQKAQVYIFTIETYAYMISRYRGRLPMAEQCIDEMPAFMPLADPSFATRMSQVIPIFEEYFRPENRVQNTDDEQTFVGAFVGVVLRIVKDRSGALVPLTDQDLGRILEDFESTGRTIRQMLAD